jgi:hypothetical protein
MSSGAADSTDGIDYQIDRELLLESYRELYLESLQLKREHSETPTILSSEMLSETQRHLLEIKRLIRELDQLVIAKDRSWKNQHRFWRDVAVNVISGIVIAGIVFLWAIFFGYVKTPVGGRLLLVIASIGNLIWAVSVIVSINWTSRRRGLGKRQRVVMNVSTSMATIVWIVATYWLLFFVIPAKL